MPISVWGVSYKTAPLYLRERLAFSSHDLTDALPGLTSVYAQEGVILSTCHRTEVYIVVSKEQEFGLSKFFIQTRGVVQEDLAPFLYHYQEEGAVNHLYRVAAGLESAILGEPEVQGQVRKALEQALARGACGPVLARLFRGAISAGKRARSETGIAREPLSLATSAVFWAEKLLGSLAGRQVLVVGVGKMGSKVVTYLHHKGGQVTVINRNPQRALARAEFLPAQVYGFDKLEEILPAIDLVISSTAAPHPIISAGMLQRAMEKRQDRGLLLIDLALPRDVDPEAKGIPGIRVVDIDELSREVEKHQKRRRSEVPKVETILTEEVTDFMGWYRSRQAVPTLRLLRSQAQTIQKQEVARAVHRLRLNSPRDISIVEQMAASIVNKLLHQPTVRLKEEASKGNGSLYADVLHNLFGLDEQGSIDE